MIDINKKYKTLSGHRVELWKIDPLVSDYPVRGDIQYENGVEPSLEAWTLDGIFNLSTPNSTLNLKLAGDDETDGN